MVSYVDSQTGKYVGTVSRSSSGEWFLNTLYLEGRPFPVLTKYEGFLLLNSLHKKHLKTHAN